MQRICINKLIAAGMHRSAMELLDDRFSHLKDDPDVLPIDMKAAENDAVEYARLPADVNVVIIDDAESLAVCEAIVDSPSA